MIFVSPQIPQKNQLQSDKSVKKLQTAQVILTHQNKKVIFLFVNLILSWFSRYIFFVTDVFI